MLRTPQERVALIKAGVDLSTIEKLYLKYNNIKLVEKPVLFDAFERTFPEDMCRTSRFEGVHARVTYRISEILLISGLILLIIGFIYPASVLFDMLLSLLFIPPIMATGLLMIELFRIISKEIERLSVSKAAKVIVI